MDARAMERPVQEVISEKLALTVHSIDRAEELLERAKRIIDRMEEAQRTPTCEGICPMCGQTWDMKGR